MPPTQRARLLQAEVCVSVCLSVSLCVLSRLESTTLCCNYFSDSNKLRCSGVRGRSDTATRDSTSFVLRAVAMTVKLAPLA